MPAAARAGAFGPDDGAEPGGVEPINDTARGGGAAPGGAAPGGAAPGGAQQDGGVTRDSGAALDSARAGVFEALGDPVRRRLLELLVPGEQPAGALVTALQARVRITQPAVSQHLKVLREAGLVRVRAEGTRRLYAVDDAGTAAARAWLARFEDTFAQPLDALATELVRGRRERRRAAPRDGTSQGEAAG